MQLNISHIRKNLNPFMLASALVMSACGGGSDGASYTAADISASKPTGNIGGAAWTMQAALVRREGTKLSIDLSGSASAEQCPFLLGGDTPGILFTVPEVAGDHPLYLKSFTDGQTLTMFVPPSQNFISTSGLIVLSNLTATSVTVGIVADADTNNVNGTFTATICPDTAAR